MLGQTSEDGGDRSTDGLAEDREPDTGAELEALKG